MTQKERYWYLKNKGLCTNCGKYPHAEGAVVCEKCRDRDRRRKRELIAMKDDSYCHIPYCFYKHLPGSCWCERHAPGKKKNSDRLIQKRKEHPEVCCYCGKVPPDPGYKSCKACRDKYQKNSRDERQRRIEAGVCAECGKNVPPPGFLICEDCTLKRKLYRIDHHDRILECARKTYDRDRGIHKSRYEQNVKDGICVRCHKSRYEQNVKDGICVRCHKRRSDEGHVVCSYCRAKKSAAYHLKYDQPPELCSSPGCPYPHRENGRLCQYHYDRRFGKKLKENAEARARAREKEKAPASAIDLFKEKHNEVESNG